MQRVLSDPEGWLQRLRTEGGNALMAPWTEAGQGVGPSDMVDPMGLDARPMEQGLDGMLVTLPAPMAPTECYFVALLRAPDGVRYFLAEMTSSGVCWAEWKRAPGGGVMRIRGEDLAAPTVEAFARAIAQEAGVTPGGVAPAPAAGGAFAGVAEGLSGGASTGGAFGSPPSGGAFGAVPTSAQPSGGAFGPTAGGAFGPAQSVPSGAAFGGAAPPKKKGMAGKAIGCGCLSIVALFVLIGGWLLYLEEGVDLSEPGDEVKTVAIQPNVPFTFTFTWDGTNYAFNEVWAVVDGTKDGRDFRLRGTMGCERFGDPKLRDVSMDLSDYEVANKEDRGNKFSAWFRVHDEYATSSSTPFKCGGMLSADKGTIDKVKIVVTRRQRPSDWIAF